MRSFLFAVLISVSGTLSAQCIPENDIQIPVPRDAFAASFAKATYTRVLNKFERFWQPRVAARGARLYVNRLWTDNTVNAQTYRQGNQWIIDAFGGLARYPGMTENGYLAVMCHELGHQIGGAPLYPFDWAAVEGQADYWATLDCMKDMGYSALQIKNASLALARSLASMGGEPAPSINRFDPSVVKKTYEAHPAAQCRLDTYMMGLACPARGEMSPVDPRVNSCFVYPDLMSYAKGSRPRCWFRP